MGRLIFENEFNANILPLEWFVDPVEVMVKHSNLCNMFPNGRFPYYLGFRMTDLEKTPNGFDVLDNIRRYVHAHISDVVIQATLDLSYNTDIFNTENRYTLLFFREEDEMMALKLTFPDVFIPVTMFREDDEFTNLTTVSGQPIANQPWQRGMSHRELQYKRKKYY